MLGLVLIPPFWPVLVLGLYVTLLAYYLGLAWNWPALVDPPEPTPEAEEKGESARVPAPEPVVEDDSDWTSHR